MEEERIIKPMSSYFLTWSRLEVATMRSRPLIVAAISALLTFAAQAQSDNGRSVPDAPAPQTQKKPAPKPQPPPDATDSSSNPTQQPAKDDNAFPEAVSREAAAKAASDASDNTKPSTANDNPFPEDVSRKAAKAAGNDQGSPAPKSDLPPGVSSSQSSSSLDDTENPTEARRLLPNPGRAKKDAEVGGFYINSGNYQGALERFQDAMANDPTNVDAIFGLAEAQQMLKKNADAARNYQLYLDIVPNGPKAKQAMKALKTLQAAK
jgi:tetratricopeptide (TPR) repeat protein